MDWSKAKTILIVLLFAVNIFLLGTYILRENDERKEMEERRESVCAVLSKSQISVKPEVVPLDSVKIKPATVMTNAKKEAVAKRLFGEITVKTEPSETVYSGNGGNIMFKNDSFSLIYESGKAVSSAEEAKALAYEISKKLSVTTSLDMITSYATDSGYTVKVTQNSGSAPIFDADIDFRISSTGNVLGNGTFIACGAPRSASGEMMMVSSVLFEFADEVKKLGRKKINIVESEYGYYTKICSGDIAHLTPAIKLVTDAGIFYMSMSDGSLIKI